MLFFPHSPIIYLHKIKNKVERLSFPKDTANSANKSIIQDHCLKIWWDVLFYIFSGFFFFLMWLKVLFSSSRSLPFGRLPPLSKQSPFLEAVSRSPRITQCLPGPPAVACLVGTLIIITPQKD